MSKSETERSQMKKNTESISRNEESMEETQKDQPKSKIKTILDFQSQPSNKTKIKSPRSLQAIQYSGYNIEDLYYVTFKEFQQSHPETITMNQKDQKKRYNFLEELRKTKINEIVEQMKYLILFSLNYKHGYKIIF